MIDSVSSATQTNSSANAANFQTDFETFLKMLTTQMQNQDPLNPVDAEDFATQLATFSSVEQQVLTNDLLEKLNAQFSSLNAASLTEWIGKTVTADIAEDYSGSALELSVAPPSGAVSAKLQVVNSEGQVVEDTSLDPSVMEFTWPSYSSDLTEVLPGAYTFTVIYTDSAGVRTTRRAGASHTVSEITMVDGETLLKLSNGEEISTEQVVSLR
jgi:flagellar basal-body rod modification protein FlgD